MKTLIASLTLFASVSTYACQCSNFTMDAEPTVVAFLKKYYGVSNLNFEDNIVMNAYYPTRSERQDYEEMGPNSCYMEGPNGEPIFYCALTTKGDYTITIPEKNCEVKVRIKTTEKKVVVRKLKTNC